MNIYRTYAPKAMTSKSGWAFCSLMFSLVSYASEATLTITKGKGIPVCEAYALEFANANANSLSCIGDMVATSGYIKRIAGPVTKANINFYSEDGSDPGLTLYRDAESFSRTNDINLAQYFPRDRLSEWRHSPEQIQAAEQGVRNTLEGYYKEGVIRWSDIDVDNDGKADRVMFLPTCGRNTQTTTSVTMSAPMLLSDEGRVDARRTKLLLREPLGRKYQQEIRKSGDGRTVPIADFFTGSSQGWFRFGDKTYWDFWWYVPIESLPRPKEEHVVKIFTTTSLKTRQVCALKVNGAERGLK